jgi:putative MATE family efflux protein
MTESSAVPAKSSKIRRDWTQGPILKNLLLLSVPMIVMEATYMVSQIFDMIWVGKAGSTSIAALGIALLVFMLVSTMDTALIAGGRAMIARFMGAGDQEGARQVAGQLYIMAFTWGVLVTIGGYFLAGPVMRIFRVEPEVAQQGIRYLRIIFAGWISSEFLVMGLYIMQSTGDTLDPMIIELCMRGVHITLCPFLVLGLGFFPQMGIAGAALSNVVSQILGALAGLWFLFGGHTRIKLSTKDIRFIPNLTWRILKIGIPSLISMGQNTAASFVLTWIIIPFGTLAVAAHSLVSNVQGFIMTPNMGLGSGVAVLVGQNLGAKEPQRAVKSTWLAAAVLTAFSVICAIVVLIWAEGLVKVFNNDPELVRIGATFLRIATAGYLLMGVNSALANCINGAGDTLPNMIINIGMIWVIQIPLAYILSNHTSLDVNGVRWAMVISTFAGAIATFAYFRTNKWKKKVV